jgi:hypothetical protein
MIMILWSYYSFYDQVCNKYCNIFKDIELCTNVLIEPLCDHCNLYKSLLISNFDIHIYF